MAPRKKAEEAFSMEKAYEELDRLIADMEENGHSLAETFSLYEKGIKLVKQCTDEIDRIEKQLVVLEADEG